MKEEDLSTEIEFFSNLDPGMFCFVWEVPESTQAGKLLCGLRLPRIWVVVEEVPHPHPKLSLESFVMSRPALLKAVGEG